MRKNDHGGLFIAFDGPNGVGKSTLIECVKSGLEKCAVDICLTKEPTNSTLGLFTREIAETLGRESLACLVAADRYYHLTEEIVPNLKVGKVVISDRYVLSSLILQGMDGVEADFIMAVNDKAIFPDIQVVLSADRTVIQERLAEREKLTRFEQGQRTDEEIKFMQKGKSLLSQVGIEILDIDNTGSLQENASLIIKHILEAKQK